MRKLAESVGSNDRETLALRQQYAMEHLHYLQKELLASGCFQFGTRSRLGENRLELCYINSARGIRSPLHCLGIYAQDAIRLMNQMMRFAAGKKLTLYLAPTSLAQSTANALYLASVQPDAKITIGRVTLNLSTLKKAISR